MDFIDYHPGLGLFILASFIASLKGLGKSFGKPTASYIDGYIICKKWPFITETNYAEYLKYFRIVYYILISLPFVCILVWITIIFYLLRNTSYAVPISLLLSGLSGICMILSQQMMVWRRYKITNITLILAGLSMLFMMVYHMLGNFYYTAYSSFYGISAVFVSYNCLIMIFIIYLNTGKDFLRFNHILKKHLKDDLKCYTPHSKRKDLVQCMEEDEENELYGLTKRELDAFFTLTEEDTNLDTLSIEAKFGALKKNQQMFINMIIYGVAVLILTIYSSVSFSTKYKKLGIVMSLSIMLSDGILYLLYKSKMATSIESISLMAMVFRGSLFLFGGKYWFLGFCLIYIVAEIVFIWKKVHVQFPFIEADRTLKVFAPAKEEVTTPPMSINLALAYSTGAFLILTALLALIRPEGVSLPSIRLYSYDAPFWILAIFSIIFALYSYLILANVRVTVLKSMSKVSKSSRGFMFEGIGNFWMYLIFAYTTLISASIVFYLFIRNPLIIAYTVFCPLLAGVLGYTAVNYVRNDYELLYNYNLEDRKDKVMQRRVKVSQALRIKTIRESEVFEKRQRNKDSLILEAGVRGKAKLKAAKAPKKVLARPNRVQRSPVKDFSESDEEDTKRNVYTSQMPTVQMQEASSRVRPETEEVIMFGRGKKQKKKVAKTVNWRSQTTFFEAFTKGMLHEQDYKLIGSMIASIIFIILLAVIIESVSNYSIYPSSWLGMTTAVMIIALVLVFGASMNFLGNGIRIKPIERKLINGGLGLYALYGIVFYLIREWMDLTVDFNNYTFPIYIFLYPLFASLGMCFYSLRMQMKITKASCILLGISGIFLMALVIYIFIRYGYVIGGVLLLTFLICTLSIAIIYAMSKLSTFHDLVMVGTLVGISLVIFLVNSYFDLFDTFIGFSVSYLLIVGSIFISSICIILNSTRSSTTTPVLFSTSVFPSYKYNASSQHSESFDETLYIMYLSMGGLLFWTVLLSVCVSPMYYGITTGTFFTIIMLVISLLMSTHSTKLYKFWGNYITDDIIKNSWLKAKEDYIHHQGATNLEELQTFKQTHDTKKRIVKLDAKDMKGNTDEMEDLSDLEKSFFEMNYIQKLFWLSNIDSRTHSLFLTEMKLIISLEMNALIAAQNAKMKEEQDLINFIKTQKEVLKADGIEFNLGGLPNVESKYYCALSQKEDLTEDQQVIFKREWEKYQMNKQLEEIKRKENEKEIKKKIAEKHMMESQCDSGQNLIKYMKIVEEYKKSGTKFTDPEFPANDESLTPTLSNYVDVWRRATDNPNVRIFDETISAIDMTQGALGDCYLLSAISVMGEKNVRSCFVVTEEQAKSGAFLIKLFRGGEFEEYILIDDYFPIGSDDSWAFARCDKLHDVDCQELWPMVLEKAYAKLYKSYGKIEGGKIHIALSEFTGGIPQYIKITDAIIEQADNFYTLLNTYRDNGYMMGAGTPENPRGDSAVNSNGIVQGHAYAILDVKLFAGDKLIKLRNPHGSRGIEWNGDWSDDSPLWTPAAIEALHQEDLEDGVFWMSVNDFVEEFKYVYICRKFDGRWTVINIEDSCGDELNITEDGLQKFPQYQITVTRPTTIFIKMTQSEKLSSFQGKYSIFALMAANEGKIVTMSDTHKMVCSTLPPINYVSVTTEAVVAMNYAYPYKFTVVAGALKSKSPYSIKFFSTDDEFIAQKIN